jgi:DinB superfamily
LEPATWAHHLNDVNSLAARGVRADDPVMDPRYPVGQFSPDSDVTPAKRQGWIAQIDALPRDLAHTLSALPPELLDTPYRNGGWTARQVVHHLADSHLNAYIRIKLALTEDKPAIKTYEEQLWAELPDGRTADPVISMSILEGVHRRLTILLESLTPEQFVRRAHHPAWGEITVDWLVQMYAWHCRHHLAHIGLVRGKTPVNV